jgi:carbamoyl-phosphate synthase large subunit
LDKDAMVPLARELVTMGFRIFATVGTATRLMEEGIPTQAMFRIADGRPNVLDMMERGEVSWVVNTPSSGPSPMVDEIRMRAVATMKGIPITTTISGLSAAVEGLRALREMKRMEICSIQEYHRHAPRMRW